MKTRERWNGRHMRQCCSVPVHAQQLGEEVITEREESTAGEDQHLKDEIAWNSSEPYL